MTKNSIFSSISSLYTNICKTKNQENYNISYLNNLNYINKSINYDKIDGNIIKTFFKREQFDIELYSIYMLNQMNLNILPEILNIDDSNSVIKYNTSNLLSLREALSCENLNYIVNELFSFIRNIKKSKITIGNLHIDNIYIDMKTMEFFIIDLININFNKQENNLDFDSLSLSLNSKYFDSTCYINTSEDNFISNIIDFYM